MATSTLKASPPPRSALTIILFFLIALGLAGTAGGAYFYLNNQHANTPAVKNIEEPIFVALEPFTVNLQPNGRSRFLHVAVTLQMADAVSQSQTTRYLPEVRSRVLTVLSNRPADSLATTDEKTQLAGEIRTSLNQPFAPNLPPQKISSVMFTTFMLQ